MDINDLISLSNLARIFGNEATKKRAVFSALMGHTDRTFVGLLGPRGVGKTVLLKQLLAETPNGLYLSLDSLEKDTDLFALVSELHRNYKFSTFFLDEVHYIEDFDRHLKLLFDNLKLKVFFSSSVALKLIESAHDLSRRVKIVDVLPFSFPEFLHFKNLHVAPVLKWEDLLERRFEAQHIAAHSYLREYLSGGSYPFSLEVGDVLGALRANLDKIIRFDIPRLRILTTDELPRILKTFTFIARAPGTDINPNVISHNLKITRYKAEQYVKLLEDAFILMRAMPAGTNVMKEPKVFCSIPYRLLENSYENCIGSLREDFAVGCLLQAGFEVSYLKGKRGEKTPDFLVHSRSGEVVVEIGGAGKGYSQFKNFGGKYKKVVFADHSDLEKNTFPLALLGFLQTD